MSRAALLTRLKAPLEIADIEPCELQYGQVRVAVTCSGICGAQLQEIAGDKEGGPLPHPLGHEGCGIVLETGPGVGHVKKGDKVVMHWRKGSGIESDFPRYNYDGRTITGGRVTTFADEVIASENRVTAVPADTPDEFCALLGCGLSTAIGTIEFEAKLRFGETILIVGCGGLGINLILAAKLAQASRIVVMDIHPAKEKTALDLGAHAYFDINDDAVLKKLGIRGFDVIANTASAPIAIEKTLPLLGSGGRYVLIGQPRKGEAVAITNARHFFDGDGKCLMATQGGRFEPSRDIPRYVAMQRAGLFDLEGIVSHRLSLADINEGVGLVQAGQAGRVMISMK